jgi:hypothetical protein
LESRRPQGDRSLAPESSATPGPQLWVAEEIKERVDEIQQAGLDPYPRDASTPRGISLAKLDRALQRLSQKHQPLERGQTKKDMGVGSYQGVPDTCTETITNS